MSAQYLQNAWREFQRIQLPDADSADVVLLVRRAFFTGAHVYRDLDSAINLLSPADIDQRSTALRQELQVFAATVHTELEGKV
jgi:hypothetical protein